MTKQEEIKKGVESILKTILKPLDKSKAREKIIEKVNEFRWAYIQLGKKREASPNDLIILQGNLADKILELIPDIPKDKPPLLSEQARFDAMARTPIYITFKDIKLVAQAQRDSDIKWYEGK